MMTKRKPNSMLIELVIVILFFSISAVIILQLFVASGDRSRQSSTNSAALTMAEDVAERFTASTLPVNEFFEDAGWNHIDEGYETTEDASGHPVRLHVVGDTDIRDAGTLDTLTLTAYDGNRVATTIPIARYIPMEGTP